jgi:hypothetical protein
MVGPATAAIGWLFSYPQDVIKTRIQVGEPALYKNWRWLPDGGFVECGKDIYKKIGWRGFTIGMQACIIRALYAEGIGIVTYEKCRQMLWQYRTNAA